ncbi:hypothetical protein R0K04_02380 [Pseudoalteromonas sp. SIMBA_153]
MRFDKRDLVSILELIGTVNIEIQKELESLSLSVAEKKPNKGFQAGEIIVGFFRAPLILANCYLPLKTALCF